MKTLIKNVIIFAVSSGLLGCEELLNPEPVGQVVVDNVYEDVPGVITGINAAYQPLAQSGAYNEALVHLVDGAGDDGWTWRGYDNSKLFVTDQNDQFVQDTWSTHFAGIARANVVLARLPDVEFSEDQQALKESIMGQALFLRALYYFNLVRLFGDVPLFAEEPQSVEEARRARTPTEEVYAQIEQDLIEAATMLPPKSQLDGSRGWEAGRATAGAANALLAKVYLTQEKWQEAAGEAQQAIESGEYVLYSSENYILNFQGRDENGQESVFEVQYTNVGGGIGGFHNTFYGPAELVQGNGRMAYLPTNDTLDAGFPGDQGNGLVQAYEAGDIRKDAAMSGYGLKAFFNLNNPDAPRTPMVNKYFVGDAYPPEQSSPVNFPLIRYAEVLLIRAEALNEAEPGNAEAVDIVNNQIRARAGLSSLPVAVTSAQDAFRRAIWRERRVELCFEGHRFFDLNRTGRLQERMAAQGININPARITPHPITGKPQYLYAIPSTEIETNQLVVQNPGY